MKDYVNMNTLGIRLKVARETSGMSQRQLAQASGVSQGMISQIEAGSKKGGLDTLEKLGKAMGVGFGALYPVDDQVAGDADILKDKLVYEIAQTVKPMTVKEKREVLRFSKFLRGKHPDIEGQREI